MFNGSGKPHAIIRGCAISLVTKGENDFVADVNGQTAEHGTSLR
jgi:hypothetical protein